MHRLAKAEGALAAAEDDLLSALKPEQRETLYRLLQQATTRHVLDCNTAAAPLACPVDDPDSDAACE